MSKRIVVNITDEDGTLLEQVVIIEEKVSAADVADLIGRNFECEIDE